MVRGIFLRTATATRKKERNYYNLITADNNCKKEERKTFPSECTPRNEK